MVRRLGADFRITWDEVVGSEDARTVGRPHIADALVAAGYFTDRTAALTQALHPASPYYLGSSAIDTTEAIRMVRAAGGVPVLAHPAAYRQRTPVGSDELREFAAAGLWGIELQHPENRDDWLPELERAAAELGLTATGASDYHGAGKPNRLGERSSSAETWDGIRALAAVPG
ncbi:PHP domain-containing protein [Leucobacter soli]